MMMNNSVSLVSTCCIKDLPVFIAFQDYITKYITANSYYLIVPDRHYSIFSFFANKFTILRESAVLDCADMQLIRHELPSHLPYGWYLQQFLKLSAVFNLPSDELFIIWDIDTCPTTHIDLFDENGIPLLTFSEERHQPYMQLIQHIYDLPQVPIQSTSYISQYFSGATNDAHTLRSLLLLKNPQSCFIPILDSIKNVGGIQRFSEYELLGYHFTMYLKRKYIPSNYHWLRDGGSLFSNPLSLLKNVHQIVLRFARNSHLSYFSVERRDYSMWNRHLDHLFNSFLILLSFLFEINNRIFSSPVKSSLLRRNP